MHETGLIRSLVRTALAAARAQGSGRVTAVSVKVGALTGLSADHLRDHWAEEVPGTALGGAELRVVCSEDITDPDATGVALEWIEVVTPA